MPQGGHVLSSLSNLIFQFLEEAHFCATCCETTLVPRISICSISGQKAAKASRSLSQTVLENIYTNQHVDKYTQVKQ